MTPVSHGPATPPISPAVTNKPPAAPMRRASTCGDDMRISMLIGTRVTRAVPTSGATARWRTRDSPNSGHNATPMRSRRPASSGPRRLSVARGGRSTDPAIPQSEPSATTHAAPVSDQPEVRSISGIQPPMEWPRKNDPIASTITHLTVRSPSRFHAGRRSLPTTGSPDGRRATRIHPIPANTPTAPKTTSTQRQEPSRTRSGPATRRATTEPVAPAVL